MSEMNTNYTTQMDAARKGIVTPEMVCVAEKEKMEVDKLMGLVAEGKVEVSKKGKYAKAQARTLTGVFESNVRGFGFVRVEGGDEVLGAMAWKR